MATQGFNAFEMAQQQFDKVADLLDLDRGTRNLLRDARREIRHSSFPPELEHGLTLALDNLGDVPLVVRSSSLLEDRIGAAFSGKYKSLFVANQGTRAERLRELLDAIAPRCMRRCLDRIRSSTARIAASSTSTKRWGS